MTTENKYFDSHFSEKFGPRWGGLFTSLKENPFQILRKNGFFPGSLEKSSSLFGNCELVGSDKAASLEIKDDVFKYYLMDLASVVVAQSLPIHSGDKVLDMCSAPGGKSLILAEKLFLENQITEDAELICNEISNPRRERLKYILQNYIPRDQRNSVFIKGIDGQYFGQREPEKYNAILLDAPCTGERHLLETAAEFKKWTPKRSKNNAVRQFSLLSSAWHAVQTGGYIMYSTCSISDIENDEVVQKLKDRRQVELVEISGLSEFQFIEKTDCGYCILPDKNIEMSGQMHHGAGPMYFSLLRRT